jgi:lysozyme
MDKNKNLIFSNKGLQLLKEVEGFRAKPYKDTGGVWTIGYGTVIRNLNIKSVTPQEAEELARNAVKHIEVTLNTVVSVPLSQNQFDALVVFIYNVGVQAFENSTLLKLLNEGKYDEAANEFKRWKYDNGKEIEGLLNRRKKEAALFKGEA